jgi:hypothetical protein
MVALIIHSIKLNVLFAMAEDDFGLSVFIFERERERERERDNSKVPQAIPFSNKYFRGPKW